MWKSDDGWSSPRELRFHGQTFGKLPGGEAASAGDLVLRNTITMTISPPPPPPPPPFACISFTNRSSSCNGISYFHSFIMYSHDYFLDGSTVFPEGFPGEGDAFSPSQYNLNLTVRRPSSHISEPQPVLANQGSKVEDYLNTEGEFTPWEGAASHSFSGEGVLPGKTQNAPPPRSYGKSDDGYNWRKYGQKQVKGGENPRSYYKCAASPSCPVKKKVEMDGDGHVTEIVYKGAHNHPKPQQQQQQPTRRSSSSSSEPNLHQISSQSHPVAAEATDSNSWASFVEDDLLQENLNLDSKRWKGENEVDETSASVGRTVREPRVVVQTTSEIDILDDGFRWRKYGQKVVKGSPNPRSYYKCTSNGCPVRKHVERAFQDPRAVITTYEGKHNHDIPPARGTGSGSNIYNSSMNSAAAMQLQAIQDPASSLNLQNVVRGGRLTF